MYGDKMKSQGSLSSVSLSSGGKSSKFNTSNLKYKLFKQK